MLNRRLHQSTFYAFGFAAFAVGAVIMALGAFWSFEAKKMLSSAFGALMCPACLLVSRGLFRRYKAEREEEKIL